MSYNQDDLEEFATQLQNDYRENSVLSDICNRRFYEKKDKDLDYIQLGKRTAMPIKIFEQGILQPTTSSFARSITQGEINFIVNDLINSADDGLIASTPMIELTQGVVEGAVQKLGKADTIFIPYSEHYDEVVNDWLASGFFEPMGEGHLEASGSQLQVRRLPSSFDIKDVIVSNSDELDIVKKRYEDTSPPKKMEIDESVVNVNKENELMVFFEEDTRPADLNDNFDEYLDILYRVVMSQPLVEEKSAVRLEAPPDIELTNSEDNSS